MSAWLTVLPGCCIVLMVLPVNLRSDWLRVKLDPPLRQLCKDARRMTRGAGTARWALLLVALLLAGCGAGDKEARARAAAEGYLQAVKDKDADRAMAFFARTYFETRSPAGWKADLRLITARLGPLQSYSLKRWTWRMDFVPPDSGTHVTLDYEVKYARDTASETFVVFKPLARGEYRIVAHAIAARRLSEP